MRVTSEAARRFLVARHALAPARSLAGGPDAVLEVFRRLGSLQFDPIPVAGRSHDLVLHARVADYDPAWCDLLYERQEIFEAYNKGLSLVPAGEFPWFRGTLSPEPGAHHRRERRRGRAGGRAGPRRGAAVGARLRARSRGRRPTGSGSRRTRFAPCSRRTPSRACSASRDRDGNRRYYDLLERLLPADVLARDVTLTEQIRHKLVSRYRAHGLLGIAGGNDIFGGLGTAKPDPRWPEYPGRVALREELIADGELVPVEVEGVSGKRFVLEDEVGLLEAPPEPSPTVAFLSPFDALVWDRRLLGSLFEFEYVWELFFPPDKRRWGWYVLPMLFRDRLVGRIEPRIDRDAGHVQVIGLWWEDGFAPRRVDGFVDAMRDALRAYLRFAGVSRLEWTPHLKMEQRLFRTRP